jgi:hypothetical protein
MTRSRLGLRTSCLCVLIFSLMAIGASVAQALPEWTYLTAGGELRNMGDLLPEVQFSSDPELTLLFTTKGGTKVAISCKTISTSTPIKLREGGKSTEGSLKFTGCITKLNGVTSAGCEPRTGAEKGVIKSKLILLLIVLHEGAPAVLEEPEVGQEMASIELGELCAIGETIPLKGHALWKDCENKFTTHLVTHLWSPLLVTYEAVGVPASLDGSVFVKLAGAHEGLRWAGLPD